MTSPQHIDISWSRVANAIIIATIALTMITIVIFLVIFAMGLLTGPHAPVAIIMTTSACAIGLVSIMMLRKIAEVRKKPNRPTTVVIDHTRSGDLYGQEPRL